jgi:hypothetical protein
MKPSRVGNVRFFRASFPALLTDYVDSTWAHLLTHVCMVYLSSAEVRWPGNGGRARNGGGPAAAAVRALAVAITAEVDRPLIGR